MTSADFSIGAAAVVENDAPVTGTVFGTGDPERVTFTRIEDSDGEEVIVVGTVVVTAGGTQSISPAGIPIGRVTSTLAATDVNMRSRVVDPVWDDEPESEMRVLLYIPDRVAPSSTVTSTSVEGTPTLHQDAEQLLLPTVLPDGWRVFAVSRTSSIVQPSSDQVFGRYEQDALVGLRVSVAPDEFYGVEGAEEIEVRDNDASIFRDGDSWNVQWGEQGVLVNVTSRGLDRETLLAAVEQLELRQDAIAGFEPRSAPADLPLLSEATTNETTPQIMTGLRLTQGDVLPRPAETAGTAVFDGTITIRISDRSGLFGSAPAIVFDGVRRGDVVVAGDPSGGAGLTAVLADGTIVVIRLPDGVASEVAEAILGGLAVQAMSDFVAILDETSARLAELPEVMRAPIDEQHTLRLRGGSADAPEVMCLDVDGVERCTLAVVASPLNGFSWVNDVLIDGRWYVFGFEPADEGWLTIAPWRVGETFDPLSATGSVVQGGHYWLSEIPTDVDDVRVLDLASVEGQETTLRRLDR